MLHSKCTTLCLIAAPYSLGGNVFFSSSAKYCKLEDSGAYSPFPIAPPEGFWGTLATNGGLWTLEYTKRGSGGRYGCKQQINKCNTDQLQINAWIINIWDIAQNHVSCSHIHTHAPISRKCWQNVDVTFGFVINDDIWTR